MADPQFESQWLGWGHDPNCLGVIIVATPSIVREINTETHEKH